MQKVLPILIKYTKTFDKQFKSAPFEIKLAFRETREMLIENPEATSIRDHPLKEKYSGYRSVNITDDYRAIYKERLDGSQKIITFLLLGTHDQLYG